MLFQQEPFRDLDRVFGRLLNDQNSSMPMDAYRRGDDIWVHVDLPGVSLDSLDVTVERNVLTISAERAPHGREGDRSYLAERRHGSFRRQVHLGDGLDAEHIDADFTDGVLILRIPVAAVAKPRRVDISSGGQAEAIETGSTPA
jgi:HSP20 family protein